MFTKVLIANRGEIALRILRACRELGISSVAVHSTADTQAMHVKLADESVCIGPPPAKDSYLNIAQIVAACEITGTDAVHPGYGFLSENSNFVEILRAHGIQFIGPSAEHMRVMGDKLEGRRTAKALGIPIVPGATLPGVTEQFKEKAVQSAEQIGYPVLIKLSAGGGGRGMRLVRSPDEMLEACSAATAEGLAAFGSGVIYLEKYFEEARHIEVQVLGDGEGNAIHLGERDCSLQRRYQKVWEEAPSPIITPEQRQEIGRICTDAMAKMRYAGAGTLEFLYSDGSFYFIEMNTRLQVEHGITEAITGLDIVQEQIRIAAGYGLSTSQDQVCLSGHAIECRINAENPYTFTPSPGRITHFHPPGGLGVRIDSSAYQGYSVSPHYDSLIGKLIVYNNDREACLNRLRCCLDEFVVDGIQTTLPLFRALVRDEDIRAGSYDINWLDRFARSKI